MTDAVFYSLIATLVLGEALFAKTRGNSFDWKETTTNFLCGLLVSGASILLGYLTVSVLTQTMSMDLGLSLRSWPMWLTVMSGLFILDFFAYWMHRIQHKVPLFWTLHETHHQATHMNLSVALRHSAFSVFFSWIIVLPLLLLDIPWTSVLIILAIHKLYDALMHVSIPWRFRGLEWLLVTPALHRVHHGFEPQYVDKNFANVFIVLDRLFGTYQANQSGANPIGLKDKGAILNPVTANIAPFMALLQIKQIRELFRFSREQ